MAATTIGEALLRASSFLKGSSPTPGLDARVLLMHTLKKDEVYLYTYGDELLSPEAAEAFFARVERRKKGEPAAYITGWKEFMGRPFKVDSRVLIPRPETEILVEEAVKSLEKAFPHRRALRILDLGTGSGAVAVTAACLLPEAAVYAIDISAAALEVARENAALLQVAERITFLEGDLLSSLPSTLNFELIIANLPYIPEESFLSLPVEVRNFEPHLALNGGEKGLALYRRLLPEVCGRVAPGGIVALEIGLGQAAEAAALFPPGSMEIIKDYAGIDRVILWRAA
ncbi:MAG TPA: peptide chain release factor N(5)-glutamine methyltransferase [Firmicutes bacterium]|nr:peptide chain release factor N(5)-glutamine methyltransferase [Bacillota bacterium]